VRGFDGMRLPWLAPAGMGASLVHHGRGRSGHFNCLPVRSRTRRTHAAGSHPMQLRSGKSTHRAETIVRIDRPALGVQATVSRIPMLGLSGDHLHVHLDSLSPTGDFDRNGLGGTDLR